MRFHIIAQAQTGERFRRIEVDGERVDFPQYRTESFAAHANPLAGTKGEPAYVVSHVGTGMRLSGGKTQAAAISTARQLIAEKSTEEFWRAIAAARQYIKATQTLA
ncbi:hypothetical protein KDW49_13340 [Burkholderia dolosa]|uniref:hypothetical protein n=1 Tax=Burkholderia cepacia complex TaxID=87882 RepID=UPI00075878F9|nr:MULTISPECIES: hypothetical protein [Burkholderia cepacia complex]KVF35401.1 hypothetical protein WJ09_10510 [Burkholderia vietnamiensis]MBR8301689.1 hypothetical protein [Burkholderia dolosa]MBU9439424.1 hypothetical protein [Burkholderia multivorans]MCA7947833.1 hypothetical protein [Burkholderia vietnamiensis]HDR9052126.1 hypothetical protein [Burkholderia vietnamiensis]